MQTMTNEQTENKRRRLMEMQEHPGQYTDEQWQALLADEEVRAFAEELAQARRAFISEQAEPVDTDAAWEAFCREHPAATRRWPRAAAVTIGVLLLSGMALAAVVRWGILRPADHRAGTKQTQQTEQVMAADTTGGVPAAPKDSLDTAPVIFEDAELGAILDQMAAHYRVRLVFNSEQTRHLRLYYNWDRSAPLQRQIDLLNGFDRIHLTLSDNTLTID